MGATCCKAEEVLTKSEFVISAARSSTPDKDYASSQARLAASPPTQGQLSQCDYVSNEYCSGNERVRVGEEHKKSLNASRSMMEALQEEPTYQVYQLEND